MRKDRLAQANKAHRRAVEARYEGTCRIYERQGLTDPKTKVTKQREILVQEELPCNLSFSSIMAASKKENGYQEEQKVKLFLAPEIEVKPGARIVVTQNGTTGTYQRSGMPAVYGSHQEIMLEAWKGWV